jgi:hypothetical protein
MVKKRMTITAEELEAAREAGRREHQFHAKRLAFHPRADIIELELVNGLQVGIPRSMIPWLAELPVTLAREMRLGPQGAAIEVRSRDIDVSVRGTLRRLVGADYVSKAGSATSEAKTAAARANGRRGGRPKKVASKQRSPA